MGLEVSLAGARGLARGYISVLAALAADLEETAGGSAKSGGMEAIKMVFDLRFWMKKDKPEDPSRRSDPFSCFFSLVLLGWLR